MSVNRRHWLAALLVVPAATFVAANLLLHGFRVGFLYEAIRPLAEAPSGLQPLIDAVILLGPVAAIAAVAAPAVRVNVVHGPGSMTGTVRLQTRGLPIAALAIPTLLLGTLVLYLVAENLG